MLLPGQDLHCSGPPALWDFRNSSKTRQPQLASTQNSLFGLCAVLPFSRTKAPHRMTGGFIKKRVNLFSSKLYLTCSRTVVLNRWPLAPLRGQGTLTRWPRDVGRKKSLFWTSTEIWEKILSICEDLFLSSIGLSLGKKILKPRRIESLLKQATDHQRLRTTALEEFKFKFLLLFREVVF